MATLGASVAIVGRNIQRLNVVCEQIIKAGSSKPLPIVADVTVNPEHIIDQTIEHFGRLDILVNNAGILNADTVETFDANEFDRILNTNLRSAILLTHLAVPHLQQTKGNVINVSSIGGLRAFDMFTSYCISKAGLDQFTKCAALALASKGIRVNAINPATIRTPIFEVLGVDASNAEHFFEERKREYLVGRVGEVSDTSAAIAYLANESFINGILLPIDGGFICSGGGCMYTQMNDFSNFFPSILTLSLFQHFKLNFFEFRICFAVNLPDLTPK